MTRLMAPVLSFTAEEIWGFMPGKKEESVFLSRFPVVDKRFLDPDLEGRWAALISLRDEVNKAIEIKRQERSLGNSLEANVILYVAEGRRLQRLLKDYADFLTTLFIVSAAVIRTDTVPEGTYKGEVGFEGDSRGTGQVQQEAVFVLVERAPGKKCERCWNWSDAVGTFEDAPELCDRCYNTLR